jgi:hypothetical protein
MREQTEILYLDIKRITDARKTVLPSRKYRKIPSWWVGPCVMTSWEIQLDNKEWHRVYFLNWNRQTNRCIIENETKLAININNHDEFKSLGIVKVLEFINQALEAKILTDQKYLASDKKDLEEPHVNIADIPFKIINTREEYIADQEEKQRVRECEKEFIQAKLDRESELVDADMAFESAPIDEKLIQKHELDEYIEELLVDDRNNEIYEELMKKKPVTNMRLEHLLGVDENGVNACEDEFD